MIVTTSEVAMRGFDFRAPKKGITLLICRPCRNLRQYTQALFRVGRHGDPCERYILQGVQGIDRAERANYAAKLVSTNEIISKNEV